jgi:hypothetical protein
MKDEARKTDLGLCFHLQFLYGQRTYSRVKDYHSPSSLKEHFRKLLKTYKVAIENSVDDLDGFQSRRIYDLIAREEEGLKLRKTFHDLDQSMIAFQSELIFLLLGEMPKNWHEKNVTNHARNWKLNSKRTLTYRQNDDQRMLVIFEALSTKEYENRLPDKEELRTKFWIDCKSKPKLFIRWFKKEYPTIYLDLF